MHLQRMANRHNRGIDRHRSERWIEDPNIDYADGSKYGPLCRGTDYESKDLGPAIRRAMAAVKRGEPALVDVVTQPQ
jgi:hypothetical protein